MFHVLAVGIQNSDPAHLFFTVYLALFIYQILVHNLYLDTSKCLKSTL